MALRGTGGPLTPAYGACVQVTAPAPSTMETAHDGKAHRFQVHMKVSVTKIKRGTFARSVTLNIVNELMIMLGGVYWAKLPGPCVTALTEQSQASNPDSEPNSRLRSLSHLVL